MKITILTLFKDLIEDYFNHSIIAKAKARGVFEVEVIDIRDYSLDKHRHVDDAPYGGGAGMLLSIEPIDRALKACRSDNSYVLLTSPKAKPFTQEDAQRLAKKKHIIIICGHYEGTDARIEDYIDERVSLGDYILSGGELASLVISDAMIRLLNDAINPDSLKEESYDDSRLEYPQYTKPAVWRERAVPEVLLSGHHQKIEQWRREQSLLETAAKRPELLAHAELSKRELEFLIKNGKYKEIIKK